MVKKVLKKLGKIARANIAIGLIAASLLLNGATDLYAKHDEIIFINPSVIRTEEFEKSLPHHAEIVYLDKNRNGIEQITEYLARKEDVDAIRIISHGNAGYFVLNGEVIDKKFIAQNEMPISSWKDALSEQGDIMLYGCKIAATDEGKDFVKQLAALTGADVAAATKEIGGKLANWTLDYKTGEIEAVTLRMDDYVYHLVNQVVTNNANSGGGSLRQAINDVHDGGEITFNLPGGYEIIFLEAALLIEKAITIDGDNSAGSGNDITVVAYATTDFRAFIIQAPEKTINLSNLTVDFVHNFGGGISINSGTLNINNCTISGDQVVDGGAFWNNGTLNIENCIISGRASNGGGIWNGGTASITNSTIRDNRATSNGGGIFNYGSLDVDNCNISGSSASNGGGIWNRGTARITNSTIRDNTATSNGGGIYNSQSDLSVGNSTITGNAASKGGGLASFYGNSETITHSTISGNRSDDWGTGIYLHLSSEHNIKNTIVANNIFN